MDIEKARHLISKVRLLSTVCIVLSIKDYYDMANNDHKPVSPETKSIQPDMCVDGNITMVKNIQPAGDYTGVSCMIYDERIMDI